MSVFFNLFLGKKVQKVNISAIADTMIERNWKAEVVNTNTILVNEKYYYKRRNQDKLYINFKGENVKFSDTRGEIIGIVPVENLYSEMKDICNVL